MDLSALEALRMLRYSRDMWDVDVYFMNKVVAMVQTGPAASAAAQELLNDVVSSNGAGDEEDDGEYDAHENAIHESTEPLSIHHEGNVGHVWQGWNYLVI